MKNVGLSGTVGAFLFLFTGSVGLAQLPGLNLGGGADAVGADFATMSKLFGSHDGFSAKSEVRMYDKGQKETISAAMNLAYLDNKTRIEIDATQMKNKDLPAGTADQLKQMGLDQAVTLIRPDKNTIYVMYPRLEACLTVPLPKKPAAQPRMDRETLGKETLDGHPCVKNKVTFTTDQGQKEELTVWNATDLKDFPVQVLARQNDDTVITRYKQIQLIKPDTKLFDLPAGFKEYSDPESFMQGIMAKVPVRAAPKSK